MATEDPEPLMYKGIAARMQRRRESNRQHLGAVGSAQWMRQKQSRQAVKKPTAAERALRRRLDDEAIQAQRVTGTQEPAAAPALVKIPSARRLTPVAKKPAPPS